MRDLFVLLESFIAAERVMERLGVAHHFEAIFDIVAGEATVDYGAFSSSHADAGAGVSQSRWAPM